VLTVDDPVLAKTKAQGESLHIVLHREIPEDPNLWRQWNDLVLQMERPEVFYTSEWALAVQSAYGASLKPLLFLGYEGESLVGVASLATDPAQETISFLAATTGDYCEFLSRPQRRAMFVDAVFAELTRMTVDVRFLALANVPADSATPAAFRTAAANHDLHLYIRPGYLCSQVDLGSEKQRQELKNSLSGKKKLRRFLRAMEREGPVEFVHLRAHNKIQTELPVFADAHVARFQATHRTSSLSTPERRLFLEELVRRFSGTGVVTLSMLTVGERPVAWNYGFQFQGSWFWYQPTFDGRQEENSPGHCLLSRIIMDACDLDEMKVVDLGLGAEGYKERFGNSTRQTLYVTVTRSWRRHLREVVRYRAASILRESPKIESAVRRMLGRKQPGGRRQTRPESVWTNAKRVVFQFVRKQERS
jgi:CelD/BcsL family acetyltransferase involved in cellulose biosynthesis